jgi:hypothetical protein
MRHIFSLIIAISLSIAMSSAEEIPKGYVKQELKPIGGMIVKPKDWFYVEGHRKHSFMWTISKENTEGGKKAYDTGVRIQAFVDIQAVTGKTPEEFVRMLFERHKKEADEIHQEVAPKDQGMFTRIGLEVEQGNFRVFYSLFWAKEADLAVVSIAGTPKDQWKDYCDTFNRMAEFKLMNMEKVESGKEGEQE